MPLQWQEYLLRVNAQRHPNLSKRLGDPKTSSNAGQEVQEKEKEERDRKILCMGTDSSMTWWHHSAPVNV
jgi:hypothetical protein